MSSDRRCAGCGHGNRWSAYSDETIRSGRYGIAAVVLCDCQRTPLRQQARALLLPGQLRWHMSSEQPRRRRQLLSAVATSQVVGVYSEARGRERDARATCWTLVVDHLLELGAKTLHIEELDGSQLHDKRNISDALAKNNAIGAMSYGHASHRSEPLLWYADAMAWAAGRGGPWYQQIRHLMRT